MSVQLPGSTASLASEYAATTINFNRGVQLDSSGFLVPVFSAQIAYQRTDYVVDAKGNKLNIVQRNMPQVVPPGPDPYNGWINLQGAELAALGLEVPTVDLLDAIANAADTLIRADLAKRGILI